MEELIASGIEIDRIGGTSMGATLGAMLALGHSPEAISEICEREFVGTRIASDYTLPLVALLRGGAARRFGDRTYGDHLVEELPREFFAVSCDLMSSELVVHRRGRSSTPWEPARPCPACSRRWRSAAAAWSTEE
jgi:predicted acylesterase/phospholipase RssA